MVVIVAAIWLAAILGVSGYAMVVVAAAICFLVGTATVVHSLLRWESAESAYEKERSAAESWNQRFLKLHSDSVRTTTVLSHMTDGILMLSPATEIVLINQAARRLLALPSNGVYLGRKFSELVRVPEIVAAVNQTRMQHVARNVSVEIIDGSTVRPIAVRVDQIMTSDPPHLLLLLRDETETQRVEAIRREFIANVSHELKTPLAAIKGYAETVELAIEDDPDAAKHFVAQIDQQCLRLEELISDMMRLARAQSGKSTLLIQSIDLRDVIEKAMASFLPVAAAKQIDLTVTPSAEPVRVMADAEAALAITQNLVSNALRHTDAGGHVTVHCRRHEGGWIMAVKDDGVGIAPEYQERIFERFYRVDRSRKLPDGGTGIGLSIVKNLTRALDGTVHVISSPGEGATFEVWLPSPQG
ncbi:PAS domain-containing protein [Roseiconus nitratireducens]|uniref:histidine kinase n=1 Tax=Roseiconus nitratireducens TaxID=2605748 RepID=A0A5M6DG18_9BACT|nr:ATP-binding protein [Roseiconus nitratireducens]KAA5545149.1 PAS domain-containing protein [Roseiconus nitratireducens]